MLRGLLHRLLLPPIEKVQRGDGETADDQYAHHQCGREHLDLEAAPPARALPAQICDGERGHRLAHLLALPCIGEQQGTVADAVDQARQSSGEAVDASEGP